MHIDRMKNLARAVEETGKGFNMGLWNCCAFGQYCRRSDLQSEFVINRLTDRPEPAGADADSAWASTSSLFGLAAQHFEIPLQLSSALFSGGPSDKEGKAGQIRALVAEYEAWHLELAEQLKKDDAIEAVTAPNDKGDPTHGEPRLHETSASEREPRVRDWAGTPAADEGGLAPVGVHSGAPAAG